MGTVDRHSLSGLFAATYKIDHLSKEQGVAPDATPKHWCRGLSLVETYGTVVLNFDYARRSIFAGGEHPSDLKGVVCRDRTAGHLHCGRCSSDEYAVSGRNQEHSDGKQVIRSKSARLSSIKAPRHQPSTANERQRERHLGDHAGVPNLLRWAAMAEHRRRDLCRNELALAPVIGLADRGLQITQPTSTGKPIGANQNSMRSFRASIFFASTPGTFARSASDLKLPF